MNIKSVAEKAGVSVATISRVLNHPETVSESTKQHVLKVMDSLDYTPNWFARGLKLNRTGVIGLLIPDILDSGYMEIAKGVEDVVRQKKHNMMLCTSNEDRSLEKEQVEHFLNRRVDGIILVASLLKKKDIDMIKEQNVPVVFIGKDDEYATENIVHTDFETAGAEAANHLIEIGYDKIGVICGKQPRQENAQKLTGFKKALNEANMSIDDESIIYEENSIEGGFLGATKLIEKDPPQAILATSDMMAVGAMEKIKQSGLKIPDDIAVVGYDNLKISGFTEPKLTTVAKPVYRMGLIAARLLMDLIEDGQSEEEEVQEILIQSKLKIRKSSGRHDRLEEIF